MSQPTKNLWNQCAGNSAASTYGKHNSCNERKPLEVIRGNVQKQAKVANIIARHWQRKRHNTQAFKPAVCHPRAARRTLRESKLLWATPGCRMYPPGIELGSISLKPIQYHYARGACPKWQKMALQNHWLGLEGVCRNQKHNAQHPPNPPTKPAAKPPNNPPN